VAGAFVLAVFGWGLGFYGPPVYLHAVRERTGWPVALVSAAVTVHFLFGAFVIAALPRLYRRFGLPVVTAAGVASLAAGLVGWALAAEPWQLFAATLFSGAGWVTMAAAAVNAIVSPWFVRLRPKALSTAYNGASVGGIVFSPLLVFLIGRYGFAGAAATVGIVAVLVVWWLSARVFRASPRSLGQHPDGDVKPAPAAAPGASPQPALPGRELLRDFKFRTLAGGMALGLFAQIGLVAHLFSLIVPALGAAQAGFAMGLATACAIAGRTAFGWLMPAGADRRLVAGASYAIQIAGIACLQLSALEAPAAIVLGVALFGFGIGNATSLPPLIAQAEFDRADVPRAVALIVAFAQASYAFAPAAFGLLRDASGSAAPVLLVAILVKLAAIATFAAGRGPRQSVSGAPSGKNWR
jgi:MFS family permease